MLMKPPFNCSINFQLQHCWFRIITLATLISCSKTRHSKLCNHLLQQRTFLRIQAANQQAGRVSQCCSLLLLWGRQSRSPKHLGWGGLVFFPEGKDYSMKADNSLVSVINMQQSSKSLTLFISLCAVLTQFARARAENFTCGGRGNCPTAMKALQQLLPSPQATAAKILPGSQICMVRSTASQNDCTGQRE